MIRSARLAVVAFASAALFGGLAQVPAEAATPNAKEYARAAFTATNHERDQHDRRELGRHGCLRDLAVAHAKRMAAAEDIWHQDLTKVLNKCGLHFVGENVAAGFADGKSVVEDGWMKSEAHRRNILERGFRRMAIGARKGEDGRWYVVQLFGRAN